MTQQKSESESEKSLFRTALERHYQSAILSVVGVLAMLMYNEMTSYREYGAQITEVRSELRHLKDQLSLVDANLLMISARVEDYNVFQHRIRTIESRADDLSTRVRELERQAQRRDKED